MLQHASSQHCAHSVLCWPVRLSDVKSLNCWGQDLAEVSILSQMPNVEVLSLSVNQISTLKYVCELLASYLLCVRLYQKLSLSMASSVCLQRLCPVPQTARIVLEEK